MRPRDHLLHHGSGQSLFDFIGLRSIDEGGDGNGLDVCRESHGMAGGVITARAERQRDPASQNRAHKSAAMLPHVTH